MFHFRTAYHLTFNDKRQKRVLYLRISTVACLKLLYLRPSLSPVTEPKYAIPTVTRSPIVCYAQYLKCDCL